MVAEITPRRVEALTPASNQHGTASAVERLSILVEASAALLRSTTHRVVNPPRELWGTSRFSIPFFLHPKSEMSLASLESTIDEAHPKAYEDATAGEYLDERLREIGLKK